MGHNTGMVRRLAIFRIDSVERVGERYRVEGYLARTGVQVYRDGASERREYRPPEEVFSADALASFRGMPVTIHHPRGLVTPRTWKRVAVGHVGDDVTKADDDKHVRASIWLQDAKAIAAVEDGTLVELSVGYTAKLDMEPGETPEGERYDAVQRDIFGNHVALLEQGKARGGATVALRLDSWVNSPPDGEEGSMKFLIRADGRDYEVEAPDRSVADAIEKERERIEREAKERADALEAKRDALAKELEEAKAKLDAVEKERERAELEELAEKARKLDKAFKLDEKDDASTIRRRALAAIDVDVDGKSDAYVEARFDVELERADSKDDEDKTTARDFRAPRQDSAPTDGAVSSLDAARRRFGGV